MKRKIIVPIHAKCELTELGMRIKFARKERSITLEAMAGKVGCSIPTIRSLESGEGTVSLGTLMAVLFYLNKHRDIAKVCEGKSGMDASSMLDALMGGK